MFGWHGYGESETMAKGNEVVGLEASDRCNGSACRMHYEKIAALSTASDFYWVVNGPECYRATLASLPDVFAWRESSAVLTNVGILGHSVCLRRLRSLFEFIGRCDAKAARSMRQCFEALPPAAQARLMMAPETVYRIRQFRKSPAETIAILCDFLNGECAMNEPGTNAQRPYWTALGDFYFAGPNREIVTAGEEGLLWESGRSFSGPYLADTIPLDFFSPNVNHAKETTVQKTFLEYSREEMLVVWQRLEDAFARISEVSEAAARLVKEFVKVIIPLKVRSGGGSTSEASFPGRVILHAVEFLPPVRLASALVHEAIHQLLYMVEYEGQFVITEPHGRVTSLWSGRTLQLHSFFHACFVWYGLANFWALARRSDAFAAEDVEDGLKDCLSGFQKRGPMDILNAHPGSVRGDALQVAATLQPKLQALLMPVA